MELQFTFAARLLQVLILRSLTASASNTRVVPLTANFGFDVKNINDSNVFSHDKTVVCVFDEWSYWREGEGRFLLSDIDPTLCSQLVYRNAAINNTTYKVIVKDSYLAISSAGYQTAVALSRKHPHLQVLLSVGGWTEGSFTFSKIAADHTKRAIFVESVLHILHVTRATLESNKITCEDVPLEHGFHGLDLAWEYPALVHRGGLAQDKDNLPLLVRDLRNALGKDYILSLTAAGDIYYATAAYNIKALVDFVDQFNIRPFDFYGAWDDKAYHHSALNDEQSKPSVTKSVNFYLRGGVPPEKLVVGVPLYGRTFLLKEENSPGQDGGNGSDFERSGLGKPTEGRFGGEWVGDDLMMGYHEVCYEMTTRNKDQWYPYWDNVCDVPFARNDKRWISFDNPKSIEAKVSFVVEKKLKGVMAWTIDTDDFKGTACKRVDDDSESPAPTVKFPLLRTINHVFSLGENKEGLPPRPRKPSTTNDTGGRSRSSHDTGDDNQDSVKMDCKSGAYKFGGNLSNLLTGLLSTTIIMILVKTHIFFSWRG